jgi:hypothetical protein
MIRVRILLSEEQDRRLEALAHRLGASKSTLASQCGASGVACDSGGVPVAGNVQLRGRRDLHAASGLPEACDSSSPARRKHGQKIDLPNEPVIEPDAKPVRAGNFASPYRNLYD